MIHVELGPDALGKALDVELARLEIFRVARQLVRQPDHAGPKTRRPADVAALRVRAEPARRIDVLDRRVVRVSFSERHQIGVNLVQG